MSCSPARLEANRKNAAKSSGRNRVDVTRIARGTGVMARQAPALH